MPRAFISYASQNYLHARAVKAWLEDRNRDPASHKVWSAFCYEYDMRVGPWEYQIRQEIAGSDLVVVIFSEHWLGSQMCIEEMTLARENGVKVVLLLAPGSSFDEVKNRWLKEQQGFALDGGSPTAVGGATKISVQLNDRTEIVDINAHALTRVAEFLDELAPPDPNFFPLSSNVTEPYPGPRSLRVDEAGIFFGRNEEIRRCLQTIRFMTLEKDAGAVIIDAPSGGGKSSFLKAGVVARLQKLRAEYYLLPLISVTQRPVSEGKIADGVGLRQAIATALADLGIKGTSAITLMNADNSDLANNLKIGVERRFGRSVPIIIPVDQGEELLIGAGAEGADERLLFVQVLKNLLASGHNIFLVTTVRQELYHQFTRLLPTNFTPKRFPLLAPTRDRYDEIIKLPFERFDRRFDAPLIERLVNDVSDPKLRNPLPLLAFTLQRLWITTSENPIKSSNYKGLASALVEATDKVVEELAASLSGADVPYDERKQKALRELSNFLFRHFITVDADGVAISKREYRREISGNMPEAILKRLRDSRIIVEEFGLADGNEGNEPYELAHEGLIHEWAWLQTELEHRKDDFVLRSRLEDAAKVWKADNEDKGSAVMNLSNRRRVMEISEGDVSRFSERFEAKTGAKIDRIVQRFVEACEREEAKRSAEIKRQLQGWRRGFFGAGFVAVAAIGFLTYDKIASANARSMETAAAQAAAESVEGQRRAQHLAAVETLKSQSQGCWMARVAPGTGSCWSFQISLRDGNPSFSCGGTGQETLTVSEGQLFRSNGETFVPSGSALLSLREGNATNLYARCDARTEAAVQQALQRSP